MKQETRSPRRSAKNLMIPMQLGKLMVNMYYCSSNVCTLLTHFILKLQRNIQLQACMHKLPVNPAARGSHWPDQWPQRLETTPYWLNSSQDGVYGKPAPEDFQEDYKHWKKVVSDSYMDGIGISWSNIRNVMDMRSVYGGYVNCLVLF